MPLELILTEAAKIIGKENIAHAYALSKEYLDKSDTDITFPVKHLRELCLSHEQLRADLEMSRENRANQEQSIIHLQSCIKRMSEDSIPAQSVKQAAANSADFCSAMPDKSQDIERKYRVWTVGGNEFKRSGILNFDQARSVKNLIPAGEFEAVMILEDGRMPRD